MTGHRHRSMRISALLIVLIGLWLPSPAPAQSGSGNPVVRVDTALGSFSIELYQDVAPITVANFLNYVDRGDYSRSMIHRSVPGFVIQGGGFTLNGNQVAEMATDPPIANEFNLSNIRGTVAMAKLGSDPNSATSQWFVNLANNANPLDTSNGGFTVFGRVIGEGMAVVDAIAALPRVNASSVSSAWSELPTINWTEGTDLLVGNLVGFAGVARVVADLSIGTISPAAVSAGSTLLLSVPVTPAGSPASTEITVRADLSSIGLSGEEALFDDGTHGDLVAGDNTFSLAVAIEPSMPAGEHSVAIVIGDAQSRAVNATLALSVTRAVGSRPYSIVDHGGVSFYSGGASTTTVAGYGRIRPDSGSSAPSGIAIFSNRQNGVVVSEAGVPATEPIMLGRVFAEINGAVNTGLAIANPNPIDAWIDFYFSAEDGSNFGFDSFTLGANQQIASFLDQAPFNGSSGFVGTITLSSSVPVAVIALRGYTNQRSEFLVTTLPVANLDPSVQSSDPVYLAHFADGDNWTTEVILVNQTDGTITGQVEFREPGSGVVPAGPAMVTLADGSSGSTFGYAILPRSFKRLVTSGPVAGSTGSVRVIPGQGTPAPLALSVFSRDSGGVRVSEAGVPGRRAGSAFRIYVEAAGASGPVNSGLAIADISDNSNTVTLELTDLEGGAVGEVQTLTLPPSGQVARFIDQFFSLPDDFAGLLRVTSTGPAAVVGLRSRTNERMDFLITTTPPTAEAALSPGVETFFPHIVDSGGWSTTFVLFGGGDDPAFSGDLSPIGQDGEALNVFAQ